MVNGEDVVVDDPFDQIEGSPSDGKEANLLTHIAAIAGSHGAAHDQDSDDRSSPGREVEESVPHRVGLESGHGRDRMVATAGEHVVPLQQLMQHDPVDESSEADPDQEAAGVEPALLQPQIQALGPSLLARGLRLARCFT